MFKAPQFPHTLFSNHRGTNSENKFKVLALAFNAQHPTLRGQQQACKQQMTPLMVAAGCISRLQAGYLSQASKKNIHIYMERVRDTCTCRYYERRCRCRCRYRRADPKSRSSLGFCTTHHRSNLILNWGICFLEPLGVAGI